MPKSKLTLYEKLWSTHLVHQYDDGRGVLYIDRHLVNEVTSPQAFESIRMAGRHIWRSGTIIATPDHNTPTEENVVCIADPLSKVQVETLDENVQRHGALAYFPFKHPLQGIVHVVAPEIGATLPGMTIVCGDSHTSTHGAFAALAFGIGTTDVEQVLATQTMAMRKSATMQVSIEGVLPEGVYAKDIVLALIAKIGVSGAAGCVIEYTGSAIRTLSMEARMTLCNMSIEAGARSGLVGVDETTLAYIEGREYAPKGKMWNQAVEYWKTLHSDVAAQFDRYVSLHVEEISPQVTWGTSPDMTVSIEGCVPHPSEAPDAQRMESWGRALQYMDLKPGTPMSGLKIDKVFIGSCTNSRIEDLRIAAGIVQGKKISGDIALAIVVPGSGLVKAQAEAEGLDKVFKSAGFEWRAPGCSMCLAMNNDRLQPGERCASTSNRNFEGRQGAGGRSHLVSPAMAAVAALTGCLTDVRGYL